VRLYGQAGWPGGQVAEISLERGEISLTGMEISPYKHSQAPRASPVAGMKVQRYFRKLFLTTVKSMSKQQNCPGKRDEIFSYKHKRNSSRLPGCLAKRTSPASI
jgi:hypothetical protein